MVRCRGPVRSLFVLIVVVLLGLVRCQVQEPDGSESGENPVPALSAISPAFSVANLPPFTLTATGSGFTLESQIIFNGEIMQTFYVSPAEIACLIGPQDTNISGCRGVENAAGATGKGSDTVEVYVRNLPPGGGDSNPMNFLIHSNHTFAPPMNTGAPASASHPDIAVDDQGYIYLLYGGGAGSSLGVYFQRSANLGETWTAPASLAAVDASGNLSDLEVSSSGALMAVFCSRVSGVYNVHFALSDDEGSNWTIAKNISNTVYHCSDPVVAFDRQGGGVVAWREYLSKDRADIYLTRSADGGSSWYTPVNGSKKTHSDLPSIVFNKTGSLWLVFQEYSQDSQVYINYSAGGGNGWSSPLRLSTLGGLSTHPRVAVSEEDDVYVVWQYESPSKKSDIYFIHAVGEDAWSNGMNLSNSAGLWSRWPDIYVDMAGNINVAYEENGKIYYIRSIDKGKTWSIRNRLDNTGSAGFPRLTARNGGHVDLAWVASSLYYCGSNR